MSAPLVVNTTDGTVWLRRAETRAGVALYAPADVCQCPEFVMATEAELAEHGITGTADVLPVPVGSYQAELDRALGDLDGANLARWEEEQDNKRLRLAWGSARMRARRKNEALKKLRARVAELEAERHTTNEALDDAARELRDAKQRGAIVAEFVAARAEYITSIRNCHPDNSHDYDRWQGHAAARRQLAERLGLPVAWPAEDAASVAKSAEKLSALIAPAVPGVCPEKNVKGAPVGHLFKQGVCVYCEAPRSVSGGAE